MHFKIYRKLLYTVLKSFENKTKKKKQQPQSLFCSFCSMELRLKGVLLLPGVYLDSAVLQPPSLRAEPSQPEEAGLGFWLVRPGGGLEGAATDSALGGRGTFQSS